MGPESAGAQQPLLELLCAGMHTLAPGPQHAGGVWPGSDGRCPWGPRWAMLRLAVSPGEVRLLAASTAGWLVDRSMHVWVCTSWHVNAEARASCNSRVVYCMLCSFRCSDACQPIQDYGLEGVAQGAQSTRLYLPLVTRADACTCARLGRSMQQ
eukprot:jgi/Ulvmu1/10951/UM007_0130.1